MPHDTAPPATKEKITHIQKVVGSILYYAIAVDLTLLMYLSAIASKQVKATKKTLKNVNQVLDYLATNPDATIRFHASDMILNIHSETSYIPVKSTKSRASGHFFLSSISKDGQSITLNCAIFTLFTILKCVVSWPPTTTNPHSLWQCYRGSTILKKCYRSMEMQYSYVCDQVKHKTIDVRWRLGQ